MYFEENIFFCTFTNRVDIILYKTSTKTFNVTVPTYLVLQLYSTRRNFCHT